MTTDNLTLGAGRTYIVRYKARLYVVQKCRKTTAIITVTVPYLVS